ncbi:peptidoglycan-binding domain-containing protein [Stappia sp.]|uniref:peptidoglycan-binding domain-containing protein n=1 Tax=Stappia sp. TaxID=1870903 RepID=UPI003D0AEBE7
MSRSPRDTGAPAPRRGRQHEPLAPPRPAPGGLGAAALDNPVAAGGWLVMALTGVLIVANAMAFQPGRHPAPLFSTRDAPSAPAAEPGSIAPSAETLARQRLVRDVQVELRRLGMYGGLLDGLSGPATERGVRAYQRARGLAETGNVDEALLARLAMDTGEGEAGFGHPPVPPLPPETAPRADAGRAVPRPSAAAPATTASIPASMPAATASVSTSRITAEGAAPVPPAPIGTASPAPGAAASPERARIARIQAALAQMGYGPIDIDGYAGEQTANAVRRFELDRGLAITGEPGARIEREIERVLGHPITG